MESINSLNLFDKIKEKYLSFVLTTVCRNNQNLRNELEKIFKSDELIWRDIILQSTPEYLIVGKEELDPLSFDSKFKEFLKKKLPYPYYHQLSAWKNILSGNNCVIATGTGSGKTEAFIMPLLNHCVKSQHKGVQAIIIYPLKALATDQGKRIGKYLDEINNIYGTDIKYGILDGDTGKRNSAGNKSEINDKDEILCNPPNVLITNYVMLERILLDPRYLSILKNTQISHIVLDEIHYYRGAQGIDVSLLIRRLQFYLSMQQDISKIQYLGTSATLGEPNSNEIVEFLFKLFNTKFSNECIIVPDYDIDFKNNILFAPKFYGEVKSNLKLNKNEMKAHSYFCAPPSLHRCQSCKKIHIAKKDKCDNCDSKLIFEMVTCRQCGKEYFLYEFEMPEAQENSDITFDSFDIVGSLNCFNNQESKEKGGDIILSKEDYGDSSRKLKICVGCVQISSDLTNECENCKHTEFLETYAVESDKNTIQYLNQQSNNKFCSSCKFEETRQSLIVPISKISDENCSHIVFDELFMHLPEDKRKLLIFTDNVQRASKFAREIEETHLKNMARAELQKRIERLTEPISLSHLIFEIINNIKRKTTINENLELSLKKELYEELMSSGKKVASLANRGVFKLQIAELVGISEETKKKITSAFEVFKKQNQILSYYEIIIKDEIHATSNFYDKKTLIEQIYREVNNFHRKRLGKTDLTEAKEIVLILNKRGFLNEHEEKYFFKEEFIEVCKIEKEDTENNYYDGWKSITNIPVLKSEIDTGKTLPEKRSQIESDFKENSGNVNFLVSTPTLELGIDIGDLDVVGLLYSPPSPAQYIQRVGRAGRGGRSSFAVTYLSKRTLDSMYFYKDGPKELVSGKIRPPSFTLDLEIPIKKALFSLFFSYVLHKTNFRKEKEGLSWREISTWENDFDKIKGYLKNYNGGFQNYINNYTKISNITINIDGLIDGWIDQLEEFISLQKSLRSKEYQRSRDIFNYFQQAGLLPDYAFGAGGSIVLVNGMAPISGFGIGEVCPPSTLDHNKSRFNCYRIDMYPANKIRVVAEKYKKCSNCHDIVSINKQQSKCPLCHNIFIINNREIIEPKVIRAKRSTFSLTQKRVIWDFMAIDLPEQINFVEGKVSEPFVCDIGMIFRSVDENGRIENYNLCNNCGELYSKNSKRSSYDNHIHIPADRIIGTKFKTRAIIIDYSDLELNHPITFLNALISATTIEAGCEDGEVEGIVLKNASKLILFDNLEGGVGFVDIIPRRWKAVLEQAKKLCNQNCCNDGCVRCIGSFRRQRYLDHLKKKEILLLLSEWIQKNESD